MLYDELINLAGLHIEIHIAVTTIFGAPAVNHLLAIEEEAEALITLDVELELLVCGGFLDSHTHL